MSTSSQSFYKIAIYIYTTPVRSAIMIYYCVELTWGSVLWDMLTLLYITAFLVLISTQTSVSWFSLEFLKQQYVIAYINWNYVPHALLMHNYRKCHFLSVFLLHFLHLFLNTLAICETNKEPINPTTTPFAPMMIYCICTGIYSSCLYECAVYYTMFDGKQ